MITIRRSEERGHAHHGWLESWHTFSFADYHDEAFMGFGPLRVINQDRVQPGKGFATHGHRNMEIVSYVLEGVLEHEDSMGHGSRLHPGEVQLMSAGSGVTHSERNPSRDRTLHFMQMWVFPRRRDPAPHYEQKVFPDAERQDRLRLVVSPGGGDGSLTIDQDASLYVGLLRPASQLEHAFAPSRAGWLHLARGGIELDGFELDAGDGAAIENEARITLRAREDAEVLLWDLPATWEP